jgi:antirestriction protein ArdC
MAWLSQSKEPAMPSQIEIQKQITDRIIEGLKSGNIPWRKPWRPDKNSGSPTNVISRRP